MTEWKMLKIEQTSDYERIHAAFTERTAAIAPDRNSSEYRRLYVTYKEALRYAAKEHAVMEGRRAEELDFDFRDDRYLDEFMRILDNICNSSLKQSQAVWKSLVDDSDYRTLQRTDSFINTFDRYMSGVERLDSNIWKYLINHFKVYGFSAQNKKLIINLQKYGNIKDDVFIKADIPSVPKPAAQARQNTQPSETGTQTRPQRQSFGQAHQTQSDRIQSNADNTSAETKNTENSFLAKYMELQDDRIVDELSTDFFKRFGRVYSHEITKNNLSAWRYLLEDEKYTYLLKQAKFTEKIANSLRYVNDLYFSVWEYIIDKTRVPKGHPLYQKTTAELKRLMKDNRYSGEIVQQGVIRPEVLKAIVDEDNFTKGHHDYPPQDIPVRQVPTRNTVNQNVRGAINTNTNNKARKSSNRNTVIIIIVILIIIRMLFFFS